MLFCPSCANLLLVENSKGRVRFCCQTCAYVYNVVQRLTQKRGGTLKEVDDVLGGDEAWGDAPMAQNVECRHCGHNEARFREMQTRSADEPTTIFYRCVKCGKGWTEN